MCVNLSGRDKDGKPPLIRPTFWTSYDPTARFSRSVFLDPTIAKFVNLSRKFDLLPGGGSEKVCDCPNLHFFSIEHRGYGDLIDPNSDRIVNQRDSFVQAIDLLFRLGFRRIYCVGTEMKILPSAKQIELARSKGVVYDDATGQVEIEHPKDKSKKIQSDLLVDFRDACYAAGIGASKSETSSILGSIGDGVEDREEQYSFSERKNFQSAANTDLHYWTAIQRLRQSRKCLARVGLELVSCTPGSRLNTYFAYRDVAAALNEIEQQVGIAEAEPTLGCYSGERVPPGHGLPKMKDIEPEGWAGTVKRRAAREEEELIAQIQGIRQRQGLSCCSERPAAAGGAALVNAAETKPKDEIGPGGVLNPDERPGLDPVRERFKSILAAGVPGAGVQVVEEH